MANFCLKSLRLTFKFNFTERLYIYNLVPYNKCYDLLFDTILLNALSFVQEVCHKTNVESINQYKLLLYRLDEHIPYLHLITDYNGLENNGVIQIMPVQCSDSPCSIVPKSTRIIPQPCGKCHKFIAGEMLDNVHWCAQCRMVYHQSCAPTFSHRCNNNTLLPPPIPPRNGKIIRRSIRNPAIPTVQCEQIDNANLIYFIKNEHIYRRGHFIVTRSGLIIDRHPIITFDTIKLIRFIYDQTKSHIFEIVCQNGITICIGHGHQSSPITDEIRLLTDQFCSHVHLQWELIEASTNFDQTISKSKQQLVPLVYHYGPENESNDKMQELYEFTYEIIGQGSFGAVEGAIRRSTRQPVAVKRIDCSKWQEDKTTPNEIDILYQLKHPGILTLQACFSRQDGIYIFTERMEMDLFEYITKPPNTGRLTELSSKYIIYQVLVAVSYLHEKNIVSLEFILLICSYYIAESL